jgi:hypothetical protein
MRIALLTVAAAAAVAGIAASTAALAAPAYSDTLTVYDGAGNVVDFIGVTEAQEAANGGNFVYTSSIAFDPSQLGNATVLAEPGVDPAIGYSDIVGICTGGVCGGGALGFASDTDSGSIYFGNFARTFLENGQPVNITLYLDPGLQAQGYSAYFWSDADVPEPAAWSLMLIGFGLAGGALRRRASVRAAI